ncbi:hypothetical protein myaer87_35080 [Microcystis aeruginosa NIES-87]|nr:hypothetical protein myaer87_35080 [Microcystis aeruginosa NIES-87]
MIAASTLEMTKVQADIAAKAAVIDSFLSTVEVFISRNFPQNK